MTPTERLTRERVEHYANGDYVIVSVETCQQLAKEWLEQNAALGEVRANHDPNIRGEDWCGLYGYAVRKRNCPICEIDKVLP